MVDRVGVEPTFRGGVISHTPQCYLPIWWPGVESSHPPRIFSPLLSPFKLPGHIKCPSRFELPTPPWQGGMLPLHHGHILTGNVGVEPTSNGSEPFILADILIPIMLSSRKGSHQYQSSPFSDLHSIMLHLLNVVSKRMSECSRLLRYSI